MPISLNGFELFFDLCCLIGGSLRVQKREIIENSLLLQAEFVFHLRPPPSFIQSIVVFQMLKLVLDKRYTLPLRKHTQLIGISCRQLFLSKINQQITVKMNLM